MPFWGGYVSSLEGNQNAFSSVSKWPQIPHIKKALYIHIRKAENQSNHAAISAQLYSLLRCLDMPPTSRLETWGFGSNLLVFFGRNLQ